MITYTDMKKYTDINAETIDAWALDGWEWARPVSHEEYVKALNGEWKLYLTPTKAVPMEWFGDLKGKKVLGLASGGGQQGPLLTAAGASVTILDYSPEQIRREKLVAEREGYEISAVRADMTERLPFDDEAFDLIFHPVSNCYIEDVEHVWRECFRVLKKGGALLAGLDNGMNFVFDEETESRFANHLPYNPLKDKKLFDEAVKSGSGVQFSHGIEEQIDGQLRAGFMLTNVYSDTNGRGNLHDYGVASFWATRAVKA